MGEILQQLEDESNPTDCTVFFRPSLGRGRHGYGEPDAIIVTQERAYIVEVKWDHARELTGERKQSPIKLKDEQTRRHDIIRWYSENMNFSEVPIGEEWDRFAERNNPDFERIFKFPLRGEIKTKSIPPSYSITAKNLRTIFEEIRDRKIEDVLLIFYRYRGKQPEVTEKGFTPVFVKYDPTLGLFTELE
ncbi:MAG: hypothetical protein ACXAAO_01205 [Candidatus Thorarchaeota archaeon]